MPSLKSLLEKGADKKSTVKSTYRPIIQIRDGERPYINNKKPPSPIPSSVLLEKPLTVSDDKELVALPSPIPTTPEHNLVPTQNSTQTTHKPDTKLTQTKHKVNTEVHTNSTQTQHRKSNKKANQTQTQHKLHTQLNTTKTQTKHELNTKQTQIGHITAIIGIQRQILLLLFEECKKTRFHITEPMTITHISNATKIKPGSIKTSIARLCERNFLSISTFKNGRGGWTQYEIPEGVYRELLQMETQHKLHTNLTQTQHEVHTQLDTQPDTYGSSSSSSNIKTTTTEIGDEWNFDISPYAKFGFTASQIKQLATLGVISASEVEQSLIEFNYDIDNNNLPKITTNKVNFLMGLLRKGTPYISESYQNKTSQIEMQMQERLQKRQLEQQKNAVFSWYEQLSEDEINNLKQALPTSLMVDFNFSGLMDHKVFNWVKEYYLKKGDFSA